MAATDNREKGAVGRERTSPHQGVADLVFAVSAAWLLCATIWAPTVASAARRMDADSFWTSWRFLLGWLLLAAAAGALGVKLGSVRMKGLVVPLRWLSSALCVGLLVFLALRVPDLRSMTSYLTDAKEVARKQDAKHQGELDKLRQAKAALEKAARDATGAQKRRAELLLGKLNEQITSTEAAQAKSRKDAEKKGKDLAEALAKGDSLQKSLDQARKDLRDNVEPAPVDVKLPKPGVFVDPDPDGKPPPLPPPGRKGFDPAMLALFPHLIPFAVLFSGLFEGDPKTLRPVLEAVNAAEQNGKFSPRKFQDYVKKNLDNTAHSNPQEVFKNIAELLKEVQDKVAPGDLQKLEDLKKEIAERVRILESKALNWIFRMVGWEKTKRLHDDWSSAFSSGFDEKKLKTADVKKLWTGSLNAQFTPIQAYAALRLYADERLKSPEGKKKFPQLLDEITQPK